MDKVIKEDDILKCNFVTKKVFVEFKGEVVDDGGMEMNSDLKSYCPTLENSCCNASELEYLFLTVSKGIKFFEESQK